MNSVGYRHIPDAFKQTNPTRDVWGTVDDLFIRKDLITESMAFKDELWSYTRKTLCLKYVFLSDRTYNTISSRDFKI